jgi:hypothetical protein
MAVASTDDDPAILQKAPPNSCALSELTQATCGIGTWTLRVVQSPVIQYNYNWQGQERQGKRLEHILLSDDSDSYCMGMVKRTGTADAAGKNFKQLVEKFNENTIWNMSRITLVAEKVQFIGLPVKHFIDLVKTKVVPVLQSTTFPKAPTPPENLPTTPSIVLFPGGDQISIGNGNRTTVLTVNIVIYLLPIPRMDEKYRDLYTWRAWLRTVFDGAVTISGNAAQVTVTGTTLGTDTYADQDYLTVQATAEVTVFDTVAFTA